VVEPAALFVGVALGCRTKVAWPVERLNQAGVIDCTTRLWFRTKVNNGKPLNSAVR